MVKLLRLFLGACAHNRTTFPQRSRGARMAHVTCLDCGREFEYDWNAMRRGRETSAEVEPEAVPGLMPQPAGGQR